MSTESTDEKSITVIVQSIEAIVDCFVAEPMPMKASCAGLHTHKRTRPTRGRDRVSGRLGGRDLLLVGRSKVGPNDGHTRRE